MRPWVPWVMVLAGWLAAGGTAVARQSREAEREVREVIGKMQNAVTQGDAAAYGQFLAPSFTALDRSGEVVGREAFIKQMASRGMRFQKAASTETFDEDLIMHGARAATRTITTRFVLPEINRDVCTKAKTVLARFDEGWRVVSLQETQLHDGPIVTSGYEDLPGTYRVTADRTFVVVRKGRTFFGTLPIGVTVPLFESPDGGLVASGGEYIYALERDAARKVTAVSLTRYGKTLWRATRVTP